jgi:TonB family protein
MRARSWRVCTYLVLAGCDGPAPVHQREPEAPQVAPAPEVPMSAPSGPVEAPPVGVGDPARRQAVLAVLSDGHSAAALPVVANEADIPFDPGLEDSMTPKVLSAGTIPAVRQGDYTVEGPLDGLVVRRVVRAHINEVRYCYNQGLARDSELSGRVVVEFTIQASGEVPDSKVVSSTVPDPSVGECVARATRRWRFPKPDRGGTAEVSYAFDLVARGQSLPIAD